MEILINKKYFIVKSITYFIVAILTISLWLMFKGVTDAVLTLSYYCLINAFVNIAFIYKKNNLAKLNDKDMTIDVIFDGEFKVKYDQIASIEKDYDYIHAFSKKEYILRIKPETYFFEMNKRYNFKYTINNMLSTNINSKEIIIRENQCVQSLDEIIEFIKNKI